MYLEKQFQVKNPDILNALNAYILFVRDDYYGHEIGKELLMETIIYAKNKRFQCCYCVCTSKFSQNICEAIGFESIVSLPFTDYVINGERPLLPEAPHTNAIAYVKPL